MKRVILLIVLMAIAVSGCGMEGKTYSEGLEEGFRGGYAEALWQYDEIVAEKNKLVVYADKYGYLTGYHDAIVGNKLDESEYDTPFLHDVIKEAYEQGYDDAINGKDTLSNYGGRLTWHNIGVNGG